MVKTKGGYMMIDLAHVSLSGVGVTFAGLYQKIYSKIGKPILLCNVNIGGTEYQDCYVQPVYTAEGFEMTVGDYTITVASNSVVTATEGIVGGGGSGASALSGLSDVDLGTLQDGEVLTYDGTSEKWENKEIPTGADELSELTDVDLDGETLQEGDLLLYDSVEQKWVNGHLTTPDELSELTDVAIDTMTLADGNVLEFDGNSMKWTNKRPSGVKVAGTNGEPLVIPLGPGASLPTSGAPADLVTFLDPLQMQELSSLALDLKDGDSVVASLVISATPTFTLEGVGAVVITKTEDVYTNLNKLTIQGTPLFTDMNTRDMYVAKCYLEFDGNGDLETVESSLLVLEANTTT